MSAAAVVSFPSIRSAVDTVVSTLQLSVPVARLELLDEVQMRACNEFSGLGYPDTPHLFIGDHEIVKYFCILTHLLQSSMVQRRRFLIR